MVRGQKGGQCRKPQEGGKSGCYRPLLGNPPIAGLAEIGRCPSGGSRKRRRRSGSSSKRRSSKRRSSKRGSSKRRSKRGGNYGCQQPNWGPECV